MRPELLEFLQKITSEEQSILDDGGGLRRGVPPGEGVPGPGEQVRPAGGIPPQMRRGNGDLRRLFWTASVYPPAAVDVIELSRAGVE